MSTDHILITVNATRHMRYQIAAHVNAYSQASRESKERGLVCIHEYLQDQGVHLNAWNVLLEHVNSRHRR